LGQESSIELTDSVRSHSAYMTDSSQPDVKLLLLK